MGAETRTGFSILRTNADRKRSVFFRVFRRWSIGLVTKLQPILPQRVYMHWLTTLLRTAGMNIEGRPIYIAPTCWFDLTDYSLITIEDKVVMSSNVDILTHDFSLARVRDALCGKTLSPEVAIARSVRVGRNSFVGRGTILMPGTDIGANCIVGAGSVVRGKVPDNSIIAGNPAQIMGNSLEWGRKKLTEMGIEV